MERKTAAGAMQNMVRGAYEFAAREADRVRQRELRCEAAWRTCCTAGRPGADALHYAVACIDAAHTALTVRALMTGSADLALPSNALVKNGSLGEPPLLRAVASELFADDFAAQRIADKLFKNNGGGDRPPKRGWRYVGDTCRKHAKRDNKENLDAASKARAARRTPVFLRVQEAGRSRAANLFPRHARIDVGTGALCGAPRKAMPLIQASAPKEPDDALRREALLLWLWRALRQGARRAARRYAEVGTVHKDGPGRRGTPVTFESLRRRIRGPTAASRWTSSTRA